MADEGPSISPSPEVASPTHVRYRVLGMLFLLSILTFLDRVCIGSAAPLMRRDLGLTTLQMGGIFSAFSLAYGIFEVPSGWLGDRFGPRRMLTRIVIWWSAFTALTGRVNSFQGLWITRFLFGAGEAGAYPNSSCAIAQWFPFVERARAQAVVWMASGLGGAIAPLIVVPLQRQFGWRNVFTVFEAIGCVWAAGWYVWFRDRPEQKRGVNASEMQIIYGGAPSPSSPTVIPWKVLVTSGNLWAVITGYFASGYAVNFYFILAADLPGRGPRHPEFCTLRRIAVSARSFRECLRGVDQRRPRSPHGPEVGASDSGPAWPGGQRHLRPPFACLLEPPGSHHLAGHGVRFCQLCAAELLGGLPGYRETPFRNRNRLHEHGRPDRRGHCSHRRRLLGGAQTMEPRDPCHGPRVSDQRATLSRNRCQPAPGPGTRRAGPGPRLKCSLSPRPRGFNLDPISI